MLVAKSIRSCMQYGGANVPNVRLTERAGCPLKSWGKPMTKNLTISDGGRDNNFGRYNAYSGHTNVISTNNLDELIDGVRAFLTSEPWEAGEETHV